MSCKVNAFQSNFQKIIEDIDLWPTGGRNFASQSNKNTLSMKKEKNQPAAADATPSPTPASIATADMGAPGQAPTSHPASDGVPHLYGANIAATPASDSLFDLARGA